MFPKKNSDQSSAVPSTSTISYHKSSDQQVKCHPALRTPNTNLVSRKTAAPDWAHSQNYFWRSHYQSMPVSEPEHDEAFVEESGIKVFQPSSNEHGDNDDEDDDNNDLQEDDDDENVCDIDPLFALDVLDDTIVEEGEEEHEEEERKLEGNESRNIKDQICNCQRTMNDGDTSKKETNENKSAIALTAASQLNNLAVLPDNKTESNSDNSFCSNSSGNSQPSTVVIPTKESDSSGFDSSISVSTNSTNSCSDCIENADSYDLKCLSIPSTSLSTIPLQTTSTLNFTPTTAAASKDLVVCAAGNVCQRSTSAPNSRPSSQCSSPLAMGLTGNMWAGMQSNDVTSTVVKPVQSTLTSQCYPSLSGRGRTGRLPSQKTNVPRHKFIIRRVTELDSSKKSSYMDSRHVELRSLDSSAARHAKISTASPLWLRRQAAALGGVSFYNF